MCWRGKFGFSPSKIFLSLLVLYFFSPKVQEVQDFVLSRKRGRPRKNSGWCKVWVYQSMLGVGFHIMFLCCFGGCFDFLSFLAVVLFRVSSWLVSLCLRFLCGVVFAFSLGGMVFDWVFSFSFLVMVLQKQGCWCWCLSSCGFSSWATVVFFLVLLLVVLCFVWCFFFFFFILCL